MFDKLLLLAAFAAVLCVNAQTPAGNAPDSRREQARTLMNDGNFKDAADIFAALALAADTAPRDAADDLTSAVACLHQVGSHDIANELLDKAEKTWSDSWRVLSAVAELRSVRQWTRLQRGPLSPFRKSQMIPGPWVSDSQRAAALRLMLQAEKHLDDPRDPASPNDKMHFYAGFSNALMNNRDGRMSWRLTSLTDLEQAPAPAEDVPYYAQPQRSAPVGPDGTPIYHNIPSSWDAAKNDGERWRWLVEKMAESGTENARDAANLVLGRFLAGQFGVQTITQDSPLDPDAALGKDTGPFAVRTLPEDETIARLATGLKRFKMPAEFNHIQYLRKASESANPALAAPALSLLAQTFENRQQYPKAAQLWQKVLDLKVADPAALAEQETEAVAAAKSLAEGCLKQITGNSGLIETGPVAPAGSKTTLSYLFRNGGKVHFTAERLDERKLLRDIASIIRGQPEKLIREWQYRNPASLGRWVVEKDQKEYIAETVAEWDVELKPLPDHFSRRANVELPFDKAGCYLVSAAMADGNVSRIVLWIQDLALLRKSAGDSQIIFVADAVTGDMVPGADLTFLGFDSRYHVERSGGKHSIDVEEFAARTDVEGLYLVDTSRLEKREWLIAAESDGRLAYLGFDGIWRMGDPEEAPDNESFFIITDRPVYRPGQDVNFKLWYGHSDYSGRPHNVAGKSGKVVIRNPRGDTVYEKSLTTDIFGGADDSLVLGPDAPLGQYYMYVDGSGGGSLSFRLEEYKKPEFEVTLETPEKALKLGDSAQLKVAAKYYFGAPVPDAKVSYKIVRTPLRDNWTPPWRWGWLYGPSAPARYDYSWYPGFNDWGIRPPLPPWLPARHVQPEIVAEGEGVTDADGVFRITLDTAPAKALFGDQDHNYEISAEVTDQSRRTIVGGGKVAAARKPFHVRVWANKGYYRVGDEMVAHIRSATPLGGAVKAAGTATVYRVSYDDKGVPKETAVSSHRVETDAKGNAKLEFEIKEAGQYRLSCVLDDKEKNSVEGAALLTVRGTPGEGDFRFSGLELVPDSQEYKPGETVRLAVNSENKNGLVLFFPRVERNGGDIQQTARRPSFVRLENGSHVVDIPVSRADRPNFFCEAIMVYKGRLYTEVREIFVPPADRTLNVTVESEKTDFLPGEKAEFKVRVTDASGEPVVGQCVVSVYDRAVEYIAGGSNIGDIRNHFWNWRRHYDTHIANSLDKHAFPAQKPGDVFWRPIGAFGSQEADWNDDGTYTNGRMQTPRMRTAGFGAPMMRSMAKNANAMPGLAIPAPAAAPMQESMAMDMAAPMDMAVPMAAQATGGDAGGLGGGEGGMIEPTARTDFADTALWLAALETDADGRAAFTVDMPENLTAWKVRTWVMGDGTRVGDGEEAVETKKNVIVRPQAPRFLTQKDQVVLSANLHNYLPRAKEARAELVLEGGLLQLAAESKPLVQSFSLAAGGEARADWIVDAKRPGDAKVTMRLLTDEESDASEITVPVVVHGARKVENFGGVLRDGDDVDVVNFTVPEERLPDQSRLEFTFSPTIAAQILEALPFLIEYPYGCTEQTLNRFLPAVVTRKFLDGMGATLDDAKRAIENRPDDAQSKAWRDKWGDPRSASTVVPVFDDEKLADMITKGVDKLRSMQNADGGWGWFSGSLERSWPHTTAVVVHGLQTADGLGVPLSGDMLTRGIDWLTNYQAEQVARLKADPQTKDKDNAPVYKRTAEDLDAFVHMILARDGRRPADPEMRDFLYRDRLNLSRTGLSMLGIALYHEKATNALDMVLDNLRQYLRRDPATGVCWLETPSTGWWWWYNDNVETQAWYLKLLSLTEPATAEASGLAKYLLKNRKNGSYWRSTRDTAYAVEALLEYAKASGESEPDMTVAVFLDGEKVMERKLAAKNILDDNRFVLEGLAVEPGAHELRIERVGGGNVYYGGSLSLFSLEDPIAGTGLELKVDRTFSKLVPKDATADMPSAEGVAVRGRVEQFDRVPLPNDGAVALQSGDMVEVRLDIEALYDFEYLVFEDMKAAGLEAVSLQSGYLNDSVGSYVEYRDQKVVVFIRYLPKGKHQLRYRFRAEVPGAFSALPTFGGGMYATDLFTNSDEAKVRIQEKGVFEK